jgi:hypothetical protein
MITRLQTIFLKHNKKLFGSLLVVIIATFVLTIGPQSIFDGGLGEQRRDLRFYGYNLASEADQRTLAYHAEISAMLNPQMGVRRDQLMDYAYVRAAGLGIANDLGIPQPGIQQLDAYVRAKAVFQDQQTRAFSPEIYNMVVDMMRSSPQFSEAAMARVLREDFRIAEVRKALIGPEVELPFLVQQEFIASNTRFEVALAHLDFASFAIESEPTIDDLKSFYDLNPLRYEVPEMIAVSAVYFRADRFLDQVGEPSEDALVRQFSSNINRYEAFRPVPPATEGDEAAEPVAQPPVQLADVREVVVNDWRMQQARALAERQSEAFSIALYESGLQPGNPAIRPLIDQFRGLTEALDPYNRLEPPRHPEIARNLLQSMWIYTASNRFFSEIGQNQQGAVVLLLNGLTPARQPALDEVVNRVELDWLAQEKRRLFSEQGRTVHAALKAAIAAGQTFAEAAAELGLRVDDTVSFTGDSVPPAVAGIPSWSQARYDGPGSTSPMSLVADNGSFIHVLAKEAPELDTSSLQFTIFAAQYQRDISEPLGWQLLNELKDAALARLAL